MGNGNVNPPTLTHTSFVIRVGDRMTLYPRGKKGVYSADFWRQGKHCRVSLKTRNRKVAEQRAIKLANDLIEGLYKAPPPAMTIQKAIDEYVQYLETEGRARKTIVRYRGELHAFRDFLAGLHAGRLSQITISLFDKFRAHRKKEHGPRSMYHEAIVVKQWLKWCHLRRWLPENSLVGYKLSKPKMERPWRPEPCASEPDPSSRPRSVEHPVRRARFFRNAIR
jgi:hypothetical protein